MFVIYFDDVGYYSFNTSGKTTLWCFYGLPASIHEFSAETRNVLIGMVFNAINTAYVLCVQCEMKCDKWMLSIYI